jgi:hypothetical protein
LRQVFFRGNQVWRSLWLLGKNRNAEPFAKSADNILLVVLQIKTTYGNADDPSLSATVVL